MDVSGDQEETPLSKHEEKASVAEDEGDKPG